MKRKNKISMRETLSLHWRGLTVFWNLRPKLFLSRVCYAVVAGFSPFVTIYFSALLTGELAGERNVGRITALAIAVVISSLVVAVFSESMKRWMLYENAALYQDQKWVHLNKLLDMDFEDMDHPRTKDLMEQIIQNSNVGGWGMFMIPECVEKCLTSVVSILCAVSMTIGLFLKKVPESAGAYGVLNHPVCIVAALGAMFGTTLSAAALSIRANRYIADCAEETKFGNRIWTFFGFQLIEHERAVDVRIYNQQKLGLRYLEYLGEGDNFGVLSKMASLTRGRAGLLEAAASVISVSFQGFIYLFVCLKAWAGAFGVGQATQYIGAITNFYNGVAVLFQTIGKLKNNTPFLRTVFEFLDIPNKMYQGSLTVEKRSDRKYEIEFRNVSFHYPSSEQWALKNVSFRFRVGERLAIVGENGSGKTTFIKLLCRLYDPTEGVILLNGIDIRKYGYKEYMSVFAVVFQDFQLLSCSLGENVAAGHSFEKERAVRCLKEAGFGDRLDTLEKGLETCLYKDFDREGVEISGGEAQKIALARALYKNAPFIILDEPTAALDPVAEQEVYEKFNEIAGDKTAVYISHRLSSCRFCDVIAVFDHGSIIQRGTHEELLGEEQGKYYELWHAQAQYYTQEQKKQESLRRLLRQET